MSLPAPSSKKPTGNGVLISLQLAAAVLDYLKNRPYSEVEAMIAEFIKCPQVTYETKP